MWSHGVEERVSSATTANPQSGHGVEAKIEGKRRVGSAVLAKVWLSHHCGLCSHLCRKQLRSYQNCVVLLSRTQVTPSAWHQDLALPFSQHNIPEKIPVPWGPLSQRSQSPGKDTGVSL